MSFVCPRALAVLPR